MTAKEFKWANELHWMVKGHLIPQEWAGDEQQVKSMENSYFKRLWGNHESQYRKDGFETAWEQRYGNFENSATQRNRFRLFRPTTAQRVFKAV